MAKGQGKESMKRSEDKKKELEIIGLNERLQNLEAQNRDKQEVVKTLLRKQRTLVKVCKQRIDACTTRRSQATRNQKESDETTGGEAAIQKNGVLRTGGNVLSNFEIVPAANSHPVTIAPAANPRKKSKSPDALLRSSKAPAAGNNNDNNTGTTPGDEAIGHGTLPPIVLTRRPGLGWTVVTAVGSSTSSTSGATMLEDTPKRDMSEPVHISKPKASMNQRAINVKGKMSQKNRSMLAHARLRGPKTKNVCVCKQNFYFEHKLKEHIRMNLPKNVSICGEKDCWFTYKTQQRMPKHKDSVRIPFYCEEGFGDCE